jgi:phosphoserine phosphatase
VRVHQHFGVRHGPGFEAFLRGEIDDEEFIRRDVGLWLQHRPRMHENEVHAILDELGTVDGALDACDRLRAAGCELAIVSGGLEYAARRVADELGIRHVSANGLATHPDGRLTGEGYVNTPLRDKSVPVLRLAADLGVPLGAVATVGNSVPDIPMFRTSGLGIAFRASDHHVIRHADLTVDSTNLLDVADAILDRQA